MPINMRFLKHKIKQNAQYFMSYTYYLTYTIYNIYTYILCIYMPYSIYALYIVCITYNANYKYILYIMHTI